MALSVDYVYKFMLDVMKKSQAGGLRKESFQYHWNNASNNYMNALLGPFQLKSNDPSNPKQGLLQNQTVLGKLQPFVTSTSITPAAGLAAKPSDYIFALNLSVGDYDMVPVTLNQINGAKASVIDPPSTTQFYYAENSTSFKILPASSVSSITLEYIKKATNVVWAYTFDANNRQVYDAANSVQPEWDDLSCGEITMRAFKTLGVSFKDGDMAQFGQSIQQSSQ